MKVGSRRGKRRSVRRDACRGGSRAKGRAGMSRQSRRKRKGVEEGVRAGQHRELSAQSAWGRTALGLVMGVGGGVAFGHAWVARYAISWWVGVLSVLAGVLLVLSAVSATRRSGEQARDEEAVPLRYLEQREPVVPLLGALLVYKYRMLTQEQLSRALEEQFRSSVEKRRLGEILLEMEMVTEEQLETVLEHQRLYLGQAGRMEPEGVGAGGAGSG